MRLLVRISKSAEQAEMRLKFILMMSRKTPVKVIGKRILKVATAVAGRFSEDGDESCVE